MGFVAKLSSGGWQEVKRKFDSRGDPAGGCLYELGRCPALPGEQERPVDARRPWPPNQQMPRRVRIGDGSGSHRHAQPCRGGENGHEHGGADAPIEPKSRPRSVTVGGAAGHREAATLRRQQ